MSEEQEKINSDSNGKITLNNSADLYKIPISVLKKTKVYNFQGKYYDKIYQEALDIEREKVEKKNQKKKKTQYPHFKFLNMNSLKIQ